MSDAVLNIRLFIDAMKDPHTSDKDAPPLHIKDLETALQLLTEAKASMQNMTGVFDSPVSWKNDTSPLAHAARAEQRKVLAKFRDEGV